jgi:predicted hotdog family 3-hydroxylacyl-ACP dehydratase
MTELPAIEALLPHRGAMRFLDQAIELGPEHAVCTGQVRPENPFLDDGILDPLALIEFIAQAAAALVSGQDPDRGPVRGWLVAGRNLELADGSVRVGDVLEVMVDQAARVGDFASFDGIVRCRGVTLAHGNVKVFRAAEET